MKKLAFLLVIVLLVSIPLSAQAATPRLVTIRPNITFSGTTATCSVFIYGNSSSDQITATVRFWHGNTCLETWYPSGTGYLSWSDITPASNGNTYVLTVDAVVAGVAIDQASVSRTYN